MKYNKQLFDQLEAEYNQIFNLCEFIFDNLIEKNDDMKKYDVMCEFDYYLQSILAKIVLDSNPKNPALFNMLKKLNKYTSFYQGINLDDWLNTKEKILFNIDKKINQITSNLPVILQIVINIDEKTKKTELSYQILESLVSLALTIHPDKETFEDIEVEVVNKYFGDIYHQIQTKVK